MEDGVPLPVPLPVGVKERVTVLDAVPVGVGVQEGAALKPVSMQAEGQGQAVGAPLPKGLKLPMGHMTCVALQEPAGQ